MPKVNIREVDDDCCPHCGADEYSVNEVTGLLTCEWCDKVITEDVERLPYRKVKEKKVIKKLRSYD